VLGGHVSHVPDKGEPMARYYRHYRNVSRKNRKKTGTDKKILRHFGTITNQICHSSEDNTFAQMKHF
jgi:hypothetical protein